MKTHKQWWATIALLAGFALLLQVSTVAMAQDPGPPPDQDQGQAQGPDQGQDQSPDQDPPGRVARLSFAEGEVSFQPAGEGDWVTATQNRPMVTGDNLWADESSRAEVNVGSTSIRLADKTGITFLELNDRMTQIRLAQGALFLHVRHLDDEDTYEVDTPNLSFRLLQPGQYRIDVSPDGDRTTVTVWHGRGRVTGGGSSWTVVADQAAAFTGTDRLDYDLNQVAQQDGFDQWAFERDAREDHSDSANYVSREMTGYEDLDEYGHWSYVAGYGECWAPIGVAGGWAPYRYGHWAWIGPYGWTWVEDEPWGFAPFHYGRWAFVGSGWFWVPGPVVVRPIWAPALVAWVGGGGWGVGIGVGVGWFPLAPGEVFIPGYRVSRGYVNQVNITNTTVNITKITNVYNTTVINKTTNVTRINYANSHVMGGVTAVSRDTFVNARPVASHLVQVNAKDIESAPVGRMAPIEPVRTSVLGAGRPATVKPPANVITRQVVAQHEPPPLAQPFDQRKVQAGGHLNQPAPIRETTPTPAPRPGTTTIGGTTQPPPPRQQDGFKPFTPPNRGNPAPTQGGTTRPTSVYDQPRNNDSESAPRSFSHPLAKPAPQVQERSPEQERGVEQKVHTWEQTRPATPPPAPRAAPPAPHSEPHAEPSRPKGR